MEILKLKNGDYINVSMISYVSVEDYHDDKRAAYIYFNGQDRYGVRITEMTDEKTFNQLMDYLDYVGRE